LTNNDPEGDDSIVASEHSEAAGAPEEIEVSFEMALAGGECLDEFVREGSGLICTPDYVAERVYLAMERQRRGK
jgi:hypothetical protein